MSIHVVRSIDAYHTLYVQQAVEDLEEEGFKIKKIKRVSKMFFLFGEDVTHIHYKRRKK